MSIKDFIKKVVKNHNVSDIHLRAGKKPSIRVNGLITEGANSVIKKELLEKFVKESLNKNQLIQLENTGSADFAVSIEKNRYRVNAFKALSGMSLVLRVIPSELPKNVVLPNVIMELSSLTKGLVLVTGPTGSGKSTTQAILLDIINEAYNHNIITIEDPIEFVHEDKKVLFRRGS